MIILDKKSCELLVYLLTLEEPETVMTISKSLNQSRRKIYYHLDKINEALPDGVESIIAYPRVGIVLSQEQKDICQQILEELDDYSYVLNIQERLQLMLTYIAVAGDRVTLDKLMNLTDVSRNTALNDIATIRQDLLEKFPTVQLEVTKARGYYLSSSPLGLIRYLYQLMASIYTKGTESFIALLEDKFARAEQEAVYFSEEVILYFEEELKRAKGKLGKTFNRQESQLMLKLLPYLMLCYRNTPWTTEEMARFQEELQPTKAKLEYGLVQEMAGDLRRDFGLQLDEIEISLIALMLLSYRKDYDGHLESQRYDGMRCDLIRFVDRFENAHQRPFINKEDLVRQLLQHCKSLRYRKIYGMVAQNPLTEHIIDKYPQLFYLTQICAKDLEEAWEIELTDDDIAYLTMHLGGSLRQAEVVASHRITLVCDEGIAVQKLLLSQCRRYLKTSQVEAVFSTVQFESVRDILTSDLVITTVDLPDSPVPTLKVHPILRNKDIVRMLRFVANAGHDDQDSLKVQLEGQLKQYIKDDKDIQVLRRKIEKLLQQEILAVLLQGQEDVEE